MRMVSDSDSASVSKESQFETLYEQDFHTLRQDCINRGKLFEDLEFLPREEFLRQYQEISKYWPRDKISPRKHCPHDNVSPRLH